MKSGRARARLPAADSWPAVFQPESMLTQAQWRWLTAGVAPWQWRVPHHSEPGCKWCDWPSWDWRIRRSFDSEGHGHRHVWPSRWLGPSLSRFTSSPGQHWQTAWPAARLLLVLTSFEKARQLYVVSVLRCPPCSSFAARLQRRRCSEQCEWTSSGRLGCAIQSVKHTNLLNSILIC